MISQTTDTLARLRELAQQSAPKLEDMKNAYQWQQVAGINRELQRFCGPHLILRLCDVIEAADKLREAPVKCAIPDCAICAAINAYDAARKALEER